MKTRLEEPTRATREAFGTPEAWERVERAGRTFVRSTRGVGWTLEVVRGDDGQWRIASHPVTWSDR